jgi:hypothetical protein
MKSAMTRPMSSPSLVASVMVSTEVFFGWTKLLLARGIPFLEVFPFDRPRGRQIVAFDDFSRCHAPAFPATMRGVPWGKSCTNDRFAYHIERKRPIEGPGWST